MAPSLHIHLAGVAADLLDANYLEGAAGFLIRGQDIPRARSAPLIAPYRA